MFCDNSLKFSLFAKVPIYRSPVYKRVNGEKVGEEGDLFVVG